MPLFLSDGPELIRLSEDEARMLGRSVVEPPHLLLAFARRGRVRDLLAEHGVTPGDVHAAIVRVHGVGDDLVLGRLPRSARSAAVLERAVVAAAERGEDHPLGVHVLVALAADDQAGAILEALGLDDVAALVDARHPPRPGPLSDDQVRRTLVAAALEEGSRPVRAPAPAFERFTAAARRAIRAAAESAALLQHREVEPFHLVLGCLRAPDSFAARVLAPVWEDLELGPIGEVVDRICRYGPPPVHQALGTFSETARRAVAEDALALAYRRGDERITSGHLLLAVLNTRDRTTEAITRPHTQRLARTLTGGLPGGEPDAGDEEANWIQFDALIRTVTWGFRRILPPGWTLFTARSDIHLKVPDSRSESDFEIRPGWIVAEDGAAPERLRQVTRWMLERLQAAVMEASGRPWPAGPDGDPAPVHAELVPDRYNPVLRVGYGDPEAPVATPAEHGILVNMVVGTL